MKNVGIDMKEKLDSKFNFLSNAIANLNLQFHNVSKGKGVVEEDSILGEPVRVRIPDLIHITDLGYTLTHTYTYHAANSPPRVDFPRFDGTNPRAWVINCNNYFKIIKNVAEDQMVLWLLCISKVEQPFGIIHFMLIMMMFHGLSLWRFCCRS